MEIGIKITEKLLGLILVVFPLNALFIKAIKPSMPEKAAVFMKAMQETGYQLHFVQLTELFVGILLLTGYFVPLSLLILLPISINILLFHLFLAPPVVGPGVLIFLLNCFLLFVHRSNYIHLIRL